MFSNNRTHENWCDFWIDFEQFSSMVKTEYKLNTLAMSKEYAWMRFIWGKGFLSRFFREFSRITYETSKTLVFASLLLMYFILYDRLFGDHYMSRNFIILSISGTGLIVVLWGLSMAIASKYIALTTTTLEKSLIWLIFERKFPKTSQFLGRKFRTQSERIVNKIKIPEM